MVQNLEVSGPMAVREPIAIEVPTARERVIEVGRIPGALHGWSPGRPRRPLDFSRIAGLGCDCGCDFNRADGFYQ
jgi:hypothetical protein